MAGGNLARLPVPPDRYRCDSSLFQDRFDRHLTVVPGVAMRLERYAPYLAGIGRQLNFRISHGMQEVRGSNPRSSTSFPRSDPNFQPSKAAFKIL